MNSDNNTRTKTATQRMSTQTMALIAVMTAVTCVLAPLSIPIGPVPITLTNFAIFLGLYVLGTNSEMISYIVYMLIGFVGLPVFSGFTGGAAKIIGPTGGYLIGFLPMLILAGVVIDAFDSRVIPSIIGMILGTILCYAFGTIWFIIQADYKVMPALSLCVIPFIPGDICKIIAVAFLGPQIKRRLRKL